MLDATLLPVATDRIRLRAMRHDDARAYADGTDDAAVRAYGHLPEPEYTEASVSALVDGPIREGLNRGDLAVLTIADVLTDEFAGSLVLFGVTDDSVEVGFWMHPDRRGGRFTSPALALAIELVRRSGFTSLIARTAPENIASQRALERSGFARGEEARGVAPSGEETVLISYRRSLETIAPLPLETERLRLRLHDHLDAQSLHRIYSRPDVAKHLLDEPWSASDTDRHLGERMVKTGLGDGATALAVAVEHQGAMIGDVQLWLTDTDHGTAEIGWVIDPACGGQGLASEAVGAVLEMAFTHYRLHRVAAQMDARNEASARLAQRVGMTPEAHLRQAWWSKGEWTDTLVYGALASDFDER